MKFKFNQISINVINATKYFVLDVWIYLTLENVKKVKALLILLNKINYNNVKNVKIGLKNNMVVIIWYVNVVMNFVIIVVSNGKKI